MARISSPSSSRSSSSGGHHHPVQQFSGGPGFRKPMPPPPPPLETALPEPHGHLDHRSPPPPAYHHEFARPAFGEPTLSALPAHASGAPHSFSTRNQPPSLGHHHPQPLPHGRPQQFGPSMPPPPPPFRHHRSPPPPPNGHGHGHPQQLMGRPAFQEPTPSLAAPALENAAPHAAMNGNHSPLSRPPPASPSAPHRHRRHPDRHGTLRIETPHLFSDHLFQGHSGSPPPLPEGHLPRRASLHHAAKFGMEPPPKEALHQYEPRTSGMGLHPPHHFRGHAEGISGSWLPSKDQHPPPNHRMGNDRRDHFDLHGHSYVPHEMAGGTHHRGHPAPHLPSPPPKHRKTPVALPSYPYPPFCAPPVPAAHLSNAHFPHLPVPVC